MLVPYGLAEVRTLSADPIYVFSIFVPEVKIISPNRDVVYYSFSFGFNLYLRIMKSSKAVEATVL